MISNSYTQQIARALTSPAQWQQQQRRPVAMPANQLPVAAQQPMQQASIAQQPITASTIPSQAQPTQTVGQMGVPNSPNASPQPIDPRYELKKPRQSNRQMNPGDYGR